MEEQDSVTETLYDESFETRQNDLRREVNIELNLQCRFLRGVYRAI